MPSIEPGRTGAPRNSRHAWVARLHFPRTARGSHRERAAEAVSQPQQFWARAQSCRTHPGQWSERLEAASGVQSGTAVLFDDFRPPLQHERALCAENEAEARATPPGPGRLLRASRWAARLVSQLRIPAQCLPAPSGRRWGSQSVPLGATFSHTAVSPSLSLSVRLYDRAWPYAVSGCCAAAVRIRIAGATAGGRVVLHRVLPRATTD